MKWNCNYFSFGRFVSFTNAKDMDKVVAKWYVDAFAEQQRVGDSPLTDERDFTFLSYIH